MNAVARGLIATVALLLLGASYLMPTNQADIAASPDQYSIDVNPLPLSIACPGAFVEVAGRSGVEVGKIEQVDNARVRFQSTADLVVPTSTKGYLPIGAPGEEQSTRLLSAIQYQSVDRPRASGLTAGYCEQPVTNGWFVSGDGGAGKESVLIVANPNTVDTQLLVEIHLGDRVTTERFVIGPQREQLISLAALVGVEPRYAVYFESGGAGLVVAIQHRYSDGLNSLGVSLDTAVRQAGTNLWIAPVEILAEGYESPRLRLFAPAAGATALVTYHSASTRTLSQQVSINSGELLELELDLSSGIYAIEIESDEPVAASVLNPSLAPLDYQWLSPLESLSELYLPIPGVPTELALLNPTSNTITITGQVFSEAGIEEIELRLSPNQIQLLPIVGSRLSISADLNFMAALQLKTSSGYAVINPSENSNPGQSLSVLIR
jgi:hypothetical protein